MELKKICSGGMVLMALLAFLPLAQAKDFAVQIDATGEAAPRPQDDFYLSVNNQWLRDTPIPPEEKRVETFSLLDLKVRQQLAEITRTAVADAAAGTAGNDEKNIAALYGCLQDKERRGNAGLGQLEQSLRQVEQAATPQEYANTMAALSRKLGLHSIIGSFAVDKEPLQNEVYTVWLQAPDTGLQRDFLAEKANEPYFAAYRAYIRDLLVLYGQEPSAAQQAATAVFALQSDLARHSLRPGEMAQSGDFLHPLHLADIQRLYPRLDAAAVLDAGGIGPGAGVGEWYANDPSALRRAGELLTPEHLAVFKSYAIFKLLNDYGPYLTEAYGSAVGRYNLVRSGALRAKEPEQQALEMNAALLAESYGRIYAARYASPADCSEVRAYIRQIMDGYRRKIEAITDMSSEARTMTLRKLDTIQLRVGYPSQWPAYLDALQLTAPEAGGCLIDNVLALQQQRRAAELLRIGRPIDREIWSKIVPQTVNAFYDPSDNSISFPAGILQAPLYAKDGDPMENLGGLGMIIAHEITHAFDSSGAQYDEKGRIRNWWKRRDWESFIRRQDKIVRFYEQYRFPDGSRQNGQQTLVENMADLGALDCLTSIVGNDSAALRRLYTSYARTWRSRMTMAEFSRLRSDIHAISAVRVNAVLSSTDGFYEAFSLQPSDRMYVAPADRMRFW